MQLKRGMIVQVKKDISKSLRSLGNNKCKRSFAGQTRRVYSYTSGQSTIKLMRSQEEKDKFRSRRYFWNFSIDDITLPTLKKHKTPNPVLFDVEQLDI